MLAKRLLLITVLVSVAAASACSSGIFGTDSVPPIPDQPPAPQAPLVVDGVRTSYADVVERTAAAVVRIEAESRSRPAARQPQGQNPLEDFFRQFPQQPGQRSPVERGMGSGVIVSADGTILTNAHVIEGADRITVLLNDNKSFEAKVVGSDKPSDLAVLKIEAQNMPFLTLGNSDSVRVGDIVLAIGNPLGIGQTVTAGIISAKGRRTGLSDGSFEDFLQTDAPINRGNSGGALVNLNAELIGINSQILSTSGGNIGIGFSIPSNMAKSVMDQLLANGRVRRGMLGVNIQNITEDTATALELQERAGVLVSNVRAGSAAEKAGVKRGDIITAINGEKIDDGNVLRNKVAGTLPGTEIRLTVIRDGGTVDLTATLDEFDTETSEASQAPGTGPEEAKPAGGRLGLTLQPVTPQVAKELGLNENEGAVVTAVDEGGAGAEAGIARGDVILEVNRRSVNSAESVQQALDGAAGRPVLLLIARRGQTVYITVRPR
jgi:serine protease Do